MYLISIVFLFPFLRRICYRVPNPNWNSPLSLIFLPILPVRRRGSILKDFYQWCWKPTNNGFPRRFPSHTRRSLLWLRFRKRFLIFSMFSVFRLASLDDSSPWADSWIPCKDLKHDFLNQKIFQRTKTFSYLKKNDNSSFPFFFLFANERQNKHSDIFFFAFLKYKQTFYSRIKRLQQP